MCSSCEMLSAWSKVSLGLLVESVTQRTKNQQGGSNNVWSWFCSSGRQVFVSGTNLQPRSHVSPTETSRWPNPRFWVSNNVASHPLNTLYTAIAAPFLHTLSSYSAIYQSNVYKSCICRVYFLLSVVCLCYCFCWSTVTKIISPIKSSDSDKSN